MSESYVIRTIADMLKIPPDRREAAFAELRDMLAEGDKDAAVAEKIRASVQFTWIDNGDPEIRFRRRVIVQKDGETIGEMTVEEPHVFSGHGDDITKVS